MFHFSFSVSSFIFIYLFTSDALLFDASAVPRFTTSLQNVTKTRGQDLAITCPARANPSPSFQWLYKGSIIGRTQELRLTSVNVSFEGTYTCRVNNTMGTASEEFFLRIIGKKIDWLIA